MRRVLTSRDWSGKTLAEHKADRATVVRQALETAGIVPPDVQRMAADVAADDGLPRYVWTDHCPDTLGQYRAVIFAAIQQRRQWREQYENAKTRLAGPVDNCSATDDRPP